MSERDLIDELAEQFVERYRRGERPSLSEYTDRYPEYAERIEKLFPTLLMMEELAPGEDDNESGRAFDTSIDGKSLDRLGDYRILREVGRGGMGLVYEAEQESLDRHVALKVLPFHGLMDANHLKRFRREARAAARLHHSNIVPVFDVGEHDGVHYYAMQFIHGQGLDQVLSELMTMRGDARPLRDLSASVSSRDSELADAEPSADSTATSDSSSSVRLPGHSDLSSTTTSDSHYFRSVARIGAQVADALAHAHEQGILHRDVKPSNLMLDTDGQIWITDFGLAKIDAKEDLTHTGDLVGTLRYMAPERFEGWSDPRSDVYGLGLTLYELLTLRRAWEDSDRVRLIKRISGEELPRPRRVDTNIPVDLETIVLKSIAREPAERYQSADQLAEDLRRFLNREPIRARRTSLGERTRMWCRRNPLVAGMTFTIAALLLTVAVGATISTIWLGSERNSALANLDRAETAEQTATASAGRERDARLEAQRSLYAARLAQARAGRWSGQMGRRFEGLDALTEAAQLARQLDLGDDAIAEIRNEAIACMALVDLRVDKVWTSDARIINQGIVYDADMERYARLEEGDFVIRRMEDNSEITRLAGFGEMATDKVFLRFSPNGRYFAAKKSVSSKRLEVVVWDLETGKELFRTPAGGMPLHRNLDFSTDGRLLAFSTAGGEIGLHDLFTGETLKPISCPRPLICIRFAPDGHRLAAVEHVPESARGRVRIIDVNRREVTGTLEHDRRIDLATWGPGGETLATPAFDGCVYIWDVATGQHRQVSGKHGAMALLADYSPTGDLLVSMASEPGNRLWDPRSGKQLLETQCALKEFSRNGRWLSSSEKHAYSAVRLEVAAPRELRTLIGHAHDSEVVGLSFNPDGRLLVSASARGSVRVWNVAEARQLATIPTAQRCRSAVFDRFGRYLVTVSDDVAVWPLNTETREGKRTVTMGPPNVVAASRMDWKGDIPFVERGSTIAFPSTRGEILSVKLEESSNYSVIKTRHGGHCVTVSPDGRWFATGGRNRSTLAIYDAATGAIEKKFSAPKGSHVQFSPDGKWLVGSLKGGTIVFWHVGSWQESHRFQLDGRGFSRMAFSRDCRLMAITDSFHVTLLDPSSGDEIARLTSPYRERIGQVIADSASGIALSPDDSTLAVGSGDGPIQLWDLRLIRRQLAEMGLDWDHSPIPAATQSREQSSEFPSQVKLIGAESLNTLTLRARLSEFLNDHPDHFEALLQRVKICWALREYDEMIVAATRLIELRPDQHDGLVWRAFPLMMLRRYEQAIDDYQRSLAIRPGNAWPMRHLAWMYLTGPEHVRDVDQARELAEKAASLDTRPLFLATLGAVCYRQGKYETAREHLEKAARSKADDDSQSFRLLTLAMTLQQLGEPDEAQRSFDEALRQLKVPVSLRYFRDAEIEALRSEAEMLLVADR